MRFNKVPQFLLLIFMIFSAVSVYAQDKKLTAEIRLIDRQKQLLDSAFINKATLFEQYEFPEAFDNYWDEWSATDVDPYDIPFAQFPDSFTVDVSNYYPPLDNNNRVTSHFGPRRGRLHGGTDFALKKGDTIRAAFDGKVRIRKFNKGGYGYYLVLRHPNGLETIYGHLSKFLVEIDDHVAAGEAIALGGNTGRSTGPHLHFETRFLGKPVNPALLIDFDNNVAYDDYYVIRKNESFKQNIAAQKYRNTAGKAYYTVRKGDTLSKIANRHRVSLNSLYRLNNLNSRSTLQVGKRIRVS